MRSLPLMVLLLGAVAMFVPGLARAAPNLVVVEARGLPVKPGQTIDGAAPLHLAEGQQVTLIAPTGKLLKLRGPAEGPPVKDASADTADLSGALRTLVTQNLTRTDKAGVIRGTGHDVIPPDPWLIDIAHPGKRCLPRGAAITLWRPDARLDADMVLTASDHSWSARADWGAGLDRMNLPGTVPLFDRSSYLIKMGQAKAVAITLIALPEALDNDAMRAAYMIQAGCDAQALALLRTVRQ